MEWLIVVLLIFFGLVLIIAEIIFVPGTTVVGVIGVVFLIAGVVSGFNEFGQQGGWITLGVTGVSAAVITYYSFKANVWGRFSLKSSMTSRVNEGEMEGLSVGLEGMAVSTLKPFGKAEINNKVYEVKTQGSFVSNGTGVRIIQISTNQIIVEPIQ